MPIDPKLIRQIFEDSIDDFFQKEVQMVLEGINERNNCCRLSIYMQQGAQDKGLTQYFADTEYNRKQNGEIKTILDNQMRDVRINCDLILHSRGHVTKEDNLIAVEVKKYDRSNKGKESDRERLRALTKSSYDGVWSNDGITLPKHVCGYVLGVFVELDRHHRKCRLEYYRRGEKFDDVTREF